MILPFNVFKPKYVLAVILTSQALSFNVMAKEGNNLQADCKLLTADRVFDGNILHHDAAVLIDDEKVVRVGNAEELDRLCRKVTHLGDATILPGFIESHAHVTFQHVSKDVVLKHGVTTVRDTGGALHFPEGGKGELRLLSSGPIIQATGGYPNNLFGGGDGDNHHAEDIVGFEADTPEEGRNLVNHFAEAGAVIIKIALEPGGEHGAPWSGGQGHDIGSDTPWPIMDQETVNAIVEEAHLLGLNVTAHVGENIGVERALIARVDEFAHIPCAEITGTVENPDLLQRAVDQEVKMVTTLDTLSNCHGIDINTHILTQKGAEFLYGSEIGHNDVPWGINAEEMLRTLHLTSGEDGIDFGEVLNVFRAATSKAGENLGIPGLGTLTEDAPADIIAVKGDPFVKFKPLEYPDLVISGGKIVVNNFK